MERLTIYADMGLDDWEQTCYRVSFDPEGAYNILDLAFHYGQDGDAECANILQDISVRLKAYEDIGPTPEQLLEIDKMYSEKCREVAELRAELKAYKDTGIPLEDILEYKKFEDELVAKSMTFGYVLRLIHADERRKSDE
ncbi:hypothetical protein [Faecalicatena contorta]|uniref:Uncharacterized protein n=1 Tax=Faecalicatena contorta TaxID=39482 RepID=A0A315ZUS9_9FIRM|nr:hypothetical protein [Faecalicatena contorta]PWJ49336.1 hypothetical protein A8805_10732 [Faecalicatena contorta]SUQ14580.1 hypothetical protein SAMN05216529_10732 [Faecalicatena contorta]